MSIGVGAEGASPQWQQIPQEVKIPSQSNHKDEGIREISRDIISSIANHKLRPSQEPRFHMADVFAAFRDNDHSRFHFIDTDRPGQLISSPPIRGNLLIIDTHSRQIIMDKYQDFEPEELTEIILEASGERSERPKTRESPHKHRNESEETEQQSKHSGQSRTNDELMEQEKERLEELEKKNIHKPPAMIDLDFTEIDKTEKKQYEAEKKFRDEITKDQIDKQGGDPIPGTDLGRKDWEIIYIKRLYEKMMAS